MNKKVIITVAIVLVIALGAWIAWNKLASTTRIALVNFQQFQTTSLIKSNEDRFVAYEEVPVEQLDRLKNYDFVLAFGMGLSISAEQRELIQSTADKGTPVYIYAATNPDNNICNLDSLQKEAIGSYLGNGNKRNYRNMARYIRRHIDRKTFFVTPADSAVESASNVLYHLDDELSFQTVGEYETYLKEQKLYREGAPKVAIVGGLNDPFSGNRENIDSLIVSFQQAGLRVYPISSAMKRLAFLQEIQPQAVVYFAHGRLAMGQADAAVDWLKARNIPIFSPITILQTAREWEKDPMGMFGGFMSQSVVMPELDGAIYPYVLNAQEVDENGLYLFKAIPDRLKSFTRIVGNFIALQQKHNAEKKLAIYYFKGAGQESLTAQGLETVPSLYNLLKRLKAEGYKVENLPDTEQAFERLLMTQGAVLNTYAEGAFDDYLKSGKPALVEKSEYESWIRQAMPKDLYADVVDLYGEAPGSYMSVRQEGKEHLAVARIELGNIALLPQPMAALGDDAFAIVHGAKSAPPHSYIGAYLWSQYAFKADAMLHFGTHGSLEFTPQKQVALSSYDWPDRLVGALPHFYYYTIGNIGESMMAKRRSYASVISYLTPPFMESETRSQFRTLQNKIQDYYKTDEPAQAKASLAVKKIAVEMGLHRELRLDSTATTPYTTEEIEKIENFAEEIANEKMTGQLYTTGIPYEAEKIRSSVIAMSADPIAYSLAALDKQRGKISDQQLRSKPFFTRHYLLPAKELVAQVLNGRKADSTLVCQVAGISKKDWEEAKRILNPPKRGMMAMMAMQQSASGGAKGHAAVKSGGGHPAWIPKTGEDVVVQTSGQFRDLAASRLSLISRAVEMAATAKDDKFENHVSAGTTEIERQLVEQGVPPKNAREMSGMRVFGGINGMYGTGIQGMVKSGDRWESQKEIAETYINNMGAVYGSDKDWGEYKAGLLRAALHNTDVVVQPRQSNTWGALSLDHVFEFMGGLNLAVRDVTGKDPDAYFADYRNRNNVKMQELKEAIGVESRSTVFNPAYIKEVMKGKASSAAQITEVVTNTYAWNVMKPDVIDKEMWDQLYDVYVNDSQQLGVQNFFRQQNPAALQEITAVMMETARKGMWKASGQQLAHIARVHTDLVKEFGATGSGFAGSNAKLQDFIAGKSTPENAGEYKQQLQKMKTAGASSEGAKQGTVLKKDTVGAEGSSEKNALNGALVVGVVLLVFVVLLFILRKKRKNN